jgi:hypothetical protein
LNTDEGIAVASDRTRARFFARTDVVAESGMKYNAAGEYEYSDAEYEYEKDKCSLRLPLRPAWCGISL